MREIRTSGSEGGAAQSNASSLPLSLMASISTGFLLDKARDAAHKKERRRAACRTNPGANFVVNLVVSFVALTNELETRSPDLPVAFPNGDASMGPLSSAATWCRFGQPAARRRLDRFPLPACGHFLFE